MGEAETRLTRLTLMFFLEVFNSSMKIQVENMGWIVQGMERGGDTEPARKFGNCAIVGDIV
jgi:hypothetical protein